jgi:hypothetical protein
MIVLFASVLLSSADPASAASVSPAPAATETKQKKICRRTESSSSRMTKRVCRTETEWRTEDSGRNAADLKRMGAR